ncbi:MAG TPA: hypothetical protein VD928_02970 [Candidatus Paceibacterota bacterium]|nr:hypothetical protein [Candidatus Paceibacterota bacterium]
MFIPKLHFYYAYPFDEGRRRLFAERNLGAYPSAEEVEGKVGEYRNLWEKINADDRVMKSLIAHASVTLPRDLEVWIFGTGMNAMSSPFLIPAFRKTGEPYSEDKLIEIFIHEIAHRLVGNQNNNAGIHEYWGAIRQEYKNESHITQNHVLVYALVIAVITDVFGDEKVPDMVNPGSPDYIRAVEIVKEKGARALIEQFRSYLK